jgi:hypothetical protein
VVVHEKGNHPATPGYTGTFSYQQRASSGSGMKRAFIEMIKEEIK